MPIPQSIKIPRDFARQPLINFQEISKGERPAITEVGNSWMPVVQLSPTQNEYWNMLAGIIVAHQGGVLVPANNATACNVVYAAADVNYTEDIGNMTNLVAAAVTRANALVANLPVGWLWHHIFSTAIPLRNINYDLQPNIVTLNDYIVQFPIRWHEQSEGANALVDGCLVRPLASATTGKVGSPVRWVNGVDSAEQICGRVLRLEAIAIIDNLDKVRTVRGLGISGDGTGGFEHWLVANHEDTGAQATHKATVAIDLM